MSNETVIDEHVKDQTEEVGENSSNGNDKDLANQVNDKISDDHIDGKEHTRVNGEEPNSVLNENTPVEPVNGDIDGSKASIGDDKEEDKSETVKEEEMKGESAQKDKAEKNEAGESVKVEIKEELTEEDIELDTSQIEEMLKVEGSEDIKLEPTEPKPKARGRGRPRKNVSYSEGVEVKQEVARPRPPPRRAGRKRKDVDYDDDDPDVVLYKSGVMKVKAVKKELVDDEDKEYSDDVKDMCNCTCKICDKEFLHHRMIKHIERTHKQGSKDKFTFIKLTFYRCKICGNEILFSYYNIGQHVKRCHQMSLQDYKDNVKDAFVGDIVLEPEPEKEEDIRVYTDDLSMMCQCKCNYCDKIFFYHQLRPHVQREHKEDKDEKDAKKVEFVKRTYYKCKICDEGMLFHFDAINRHLYTHKITLKEYKTAHPAFSGEESYKTTRKTCDRLKRKRKYEFDAASVQKWSVTVAAGKTKYYSNNLEEMCLRRCRLCEEVMTHDALKYHLTHDHKEYEGNATTMDFVRQTYHKCVACDKDVLFTYNSLSKHTKRWHKINFKEYQSTYNPFDETSCDLTPRVEPPPPPTPSVSNHLAAHFPIASNHLAVSSHLAPSFVARKSVPKAAKSAPILLNPLPNIVPKQEVLDHHRPHQHHQQHHSLPLFHQPVYGSSGSLDLKLRLDGPPPHQQDQAQPRQSVVVHTSDQTPPPTSQHHVNSFIKVENTWFDGNSFQCLQCGFITRSLATFESHVKVYHAVTLQEFSPYIGKTNTMYRCQLCMQEMYHEKTVISDHLLYHNLDLQTYSNIYHPSPVF